MMRTVRMYHVTLSCGERLEGEPSCGSATMSAICLEVCHAPDAGSRAPCAHGACFDHAVEGVGGSTYHPPRDREPWQCACSAGARNIGGRPVRTGRRLDGDYFYGRRLNFVARAVHRQLPK